MSTGTKLEGIAGLLIAAGGLYIAYRIWRQQGSGAGSSTLGSGANSYTLLSGTLPTPVSPYDSSGYYGSAGSTGQASNPTIVIDNGRVKPVASNVGVAFNPTYIQTPSGSFHGVTAANINGITSVVQSIAPSPQQFAQSYAANPSNPYYNQLAPTPNISISNGYINTTTPSGFVTTYKQYSVYPKT